MLADYAVRVEQSRGRRYPEPPHAYRNDFQRDRDRVVHARAFRRLEAKTQVFTRRYSDHFRNRLTHTIEVAQISRTIAAQLGLNVDLTEALALVHDIGHPPFGHAGEKALDAAMRHHGLSFDHNLHALRIVEDFEQRYASFRGLNLTFEVREGIVKHSRDYTAAEHPELAEYLLDQRQPLEAQIIDLTDEIAYSTADLDDGCEARLLAVEQIADSVAIFGRSFDEARKLYPAAAERLQFNEALKRVFDCLVSDLISQHAPAGRGGWRSLAGGGSPASVAPGRVQPAGRAGAARTQGVSIRESLFQPRARGRKRRRRAHCRRAIRALDGEPEDLPRSYRDKAAPDRGPQAAQSSPTEVKDPLPRVICDYIAGMTDPFIYQQYEKYCGE